MNDINKHKPLFKTNDIIISKSNLNVIYIIDNVYTQDYAIRPLQKDNWSYSSINFTDNYYKLHPLYNTKVGRVLLEMEYVTDVTSS